MEMTLSRALTTNGRIEISLRPSDKAILARAAALQRLDLTHYITSHILPQAKADILKFEKLDLSERDTLCVLELLENPPTAPKRLLRVAQAGCKLS